MIRSVVQRRASSLAVLAVCLGTLAMSGCGVLFGDQPTPPVVVTPARAEVRAGSTQQFTAEVNGALPASAAAVTGPAIPVQPAHLELVSDARQMSAAATTSATTGSAAQVTWFVNDVAGGNATLGTINSKGLYTAPAVLPTTTAITIKAIFAPFDLIFIMISPCFTNRYKS